MKESIIGIVFCSLILQIVLSEPVCQKLTISTDLQLSSDDVFADGVLQDKWSRHSQNPVIVSASILLDYLYVNIKGDHDDLDETSFKLNFNDHFFANSNLKNIAKSDGKFTLEIEYRYSMMVYLRCKETGGTLIDYDLEVVVPGCDTIHLFWKKICGNPLTGKQGLTMDVAYKKYNQTIVKNGILVNASYFDRDLDNFVFKVPSNNDQTKFYLYIEDQLVDSKITTNLEQPLEVFLSIPILDADTSILNPTMSGQLGMGGTINVEPQSIIINYNCLEKADTILELSMPFEYFKDLNLVFVKRCSNPNSSGSGTFIWFLISLLCFEMLGTLYNIFVKNKSGREAVPCSKIVIGLCMKLTFIQNLTKGSSGRPYEKAMDEEFDTDLRVERGDNLANKYGSI